MSVTEGEDKPLKYPHVFRAASGARADEGRISLRTSTSIRRHHRERAARQPDARRVPGRARRAATGSPSGAAGCARSWRRHDRRGCRLRARVRADRGAARPSSARWSPLPAWHASRMSSAASCALLRRRPRARARPRAHRRRGRRALRRSCCAPTSCSRACSCCTACTRGTTEQRIEQRARLRAGELGAAPTTRSSSTSLADGGRAPAREPRARRRRDVVAGSPRASIRRAIEAAAPEITSIEIAGLPRPRDPTPRADPDARGAP